MAFAGVLDIFNSDAFQLTNMTEAINRLPYVPGRAGSLGVFEETGVTTTSVMIEEMNGELSLVPNTMRGAPPNQNKSGKRRARSLVIPHLPVEDTILAAQLQNVRAFGGSQLQGLAQVRDQKLSEMASMLDATVEYGRIGAIKGVILDADGTSVIYDLFDEFDRVQESVDFVLGTSGTDVKGKIMEAKRHIEDALGAMTYQRIHCYCGNDWFDKFTSHQAVREAWNRWQDGSFLRQDNRSGFEYCGVWFENYRGKVGGVDFIEADEAHFFPIGVPNLFKTYFAPGDFLETANTPGLPRYARSQPLDYNKGLKILVESNPLSICTRPEVLVKGTTSN